MTNIFILFVIFTLMGSAANKRVVTIHWKNRPDISFEIFSNLRNLCISYPEYNYNTLNNYLSKAKTAYENDDVRIERKNIIMQPKLIFDNTPIVTNRIVPVIRRVALKDADQNNSDLDYWLTQSPAKRLAAVTFIISQSLYEGERMNKTMVNKQKMKA